MSKRLASLTSALLVLAMALPVMAGAIGHGAAQNVLVICTGTERLIVRLGADGTPKPLIEKAEPCLMAHALASHPGPASTPGSPGLVQRTAPITIPAPGGLKAYLRPPGRAPPSVHLTL